MSDMKITTRDFSPFGRMLARSLLNEAPVAETRGAEALSHYLQYMKPRGTRDLQNRDREEKQCEAMYSASSCIRRIVS